MAGLSRSKTKSVSPVSMYTHSTRSRLLPFFIHREERERRRRSKEAAKCAWNSKACHHAVHLPRQRWPRLWRRAKEKHCAPHKVKRSLCHPQSLLSSICGRVFVSAQEQDLRGGRIFFFLPPIFLLLSCLSVKSPQGKDTKSPGPLVSPPCRWPEDQRLSARLNEPRVEASALRGRTQHE